MGELSIEEAMAVAEDRITHDVEACSFEAIKNSEMGEASYESRIDPIETHVGSKDVWFRVGDKGFCGVWEPGNRPGTLRCAPLYVLPEHRREGIASSMTAHRVLYGLKRPDITRVDSYSHFPMLYTPMGFIEGDSYEMGTTYVYYEK